MKGLIGLLKSELARIIIGLSLFVPAFILERVGEGAAEHTLYIISIILYALSLAVAGIPVFLGAFRGIIRRDLLDEKFLMSLASVGAMIIGEMSEGVAVMLFFLVGEYFEHRAVAHSRRSIRALMDIRPDEACVVGEDGEERVMDAEDVEVGSIIVVRAGERVPIDSVVISGSADLDTSALTGESIPRPVCEGSAVEGGAVVVGGVIRCKTLRTADESAAARILELVENANESKSREESFITGFSRFYTPIVVGLAVLVAVFPPLFVDNITFSDSIYSALAFLVISCPCALVISVPMAFFGGIGGAASRGILFKGGNVFSAVARADSFVFDKTGTLTSGSFSVREVVPVGISEEELMYYAASAEYGSTHPLAECIKGAARDAVIPEEYEELAGLGVRATVKGHTVLVGTERLLAGCGVASPSDTGAATVLVAIDGRYAGKIIVKDEIKSEAESAIRELSALGAKRTVMLSGDKKERAYEVAQALAIDEAVPELLPEEKYRKLEKIIAASSAVCYVGDGINDAPALALADVGVAMGAIGSDSAIEAADVVIMSDDLTRLPLAVRIARKTVRIAKANIVFALGVKLGVMILSVLGLANMWLAVFADVGVAVLAILNSMRTLSARGK
ncbi:MAG: cadmium-translocating P-type ATPase [Clostridia bacterium]|nr:cadmium-translocating P-type ATPase [Clostridia bacterium]